jgi:mannose-6-phosphate isomerase-like protein (cupin superfamily)
MNDVRDPIVSLAQDKNETPTPEGCYIIESLNVPIDEAVSIARARVPRGTTTQLHHLEGVTERYLIIAGRGRARVGNLEGIDLGPGDVVLIPPGVPQQIRTVGQEDLIFYCICNPRFRPECYVALE